MLSTALTKSCIKKIIAAALVIVLVGMTNGAYAYSGEELSKDAKIGLTEARTIATKARPGTITDEELEKEKGGTGLRYSFDIQDGSITYEVGVDAKTGKVLENKREGSNPD